MQIIFIFIFADILLPAQKKELSAMKNEYAVVSGCVGCDVCRWLCKFEAITFDHNGAHIDPNKCIGCGKCIENCQSYSIKMVSR